jgi:hypothetical protein
MAKRYQELPRASKEWLRATKKTIGEESEFTYKREKNSKIHIKINQQSHQQSTIKCNSLSFSS